MVLTAAELDKSKVYSAKAQKYARYRWDYAPLALQTLFERSGLTTKSVVADVGAGTGISTRHFAGRVKQVYALEPNDDMRQLAETALRDVPSCRFIKAYAEATSLPAHSIDLVAAAQALHWFDAEGAHHEFMRILKPGGWLAGLRNYGTDQSLNRELGALSSAGYGFDVAARAALPPKKPLACYFGSDDFQVLTFPFTLRQGWDEFFGALTTTAFMPDEDHPLYPRLEGAARDIFERFSCDGSLLVNGVTELCLGHVRA